MKMPPCVFYVFYEVLLTNKFAIQVGVAGPVFSIIRRRKYLSYFLMVIQSLRYLMCGIGYGVSALEVS